MLVVEIRFWSIAKVSLTSLGFDRSANCLGDLDFPQFIYELCICVYREPVPREIYSDLLRLQQQSAAQPDGGKIQTEDVIDGIRNKKRKQQKKSKENEVDDEVYTSMRFCATKPAAADDDLTSRELAKVHSQQLIE